MPTTDQVLAALEIARAAAAKAPTRPVYALGAYRDPALLCAESKHYAALDALSVAEGAAEKCGIVLPCECAYEHQCDVCARRADRWSRCQAHTVRDMWNNIRSEFPEGEAGDLACGRAIVRRQ